MTRVLIAFVISALSFQAGLFGQSQATIEGVVLDLTTNSPLEGVQVTLHPHETAVSLNPQVPPAQLPQATTDMQGRFSLKTSQTGRFRVVPTKSGFVFARQSGTYAPSLPGSWVQLSNTTRVEGLELRLARPAVISGTVVQADGQQNVATVELLQYSYGKSGQRSLVKGPTSFQLTNDRGDFRFFDLPAGEYYARIGYVLEAVDPGIFFYYPGDKDEAKAIPIRVGFGEELRLNPVTLPVRPKPVELTLRITGPPNQPPGQRLTANISLGNGTFRKTLLSNTGDFAIPVAPGHYSVLVTSDAFVPNSTAVSRDKYYAVLSVDVGTADVVYDVALTRPAPKLIGKMFMENSAGEPQIAPPSILCRLDGRSTMNCLDSRPEPGTYELEFQGIPADGYVQSVRAQDRDVLVEGLNIAGDTELEIVLARGGAIVSGAVRTKTGELISDATVALIPDAPYRGAGPRYRSSVTDLNGKFELHGIAPGKYRLLAWSDIQGAAYRNSESMKEFDAHGTPVTIGKGTHEIVNLTAF
jgi:hypothetical protein